MKAVAVFPDTHQVKLIELEVPRISRPDQVMLRLLDIEYVVDSERYMTAVPSDLREIAVLAEPLTIAEKALAQTFWMMQHRPPWLDPQTPSQERGRGLSALV